MKFNLNIDFEISYTKIVNWIYRYYKYDYLKLMKKHNIDAANGSSTTHIISHIVYVDPDWTSDIMLAITGISVWVNKIDILAIKKIINILLNSASINDKKVQIEKALGGRSRCNIFLL